MTARADRPTEPPALDELRHDLARVGWEERRAARELTDAIQASPPAREALQRWDAVRLRRLALEEQIARLGQAEVD